MMRLHGTFHLPILDGDTESAKTRVETCIEALQARLISSTEKDGKYVVIFVNTLPETPFTLFHWMLHGLIHSYGLEIIERGA